MRKRRLAISLWLLFVAGGAAQQAQAPAGLGTWSSLKPLYEPVSNNAVASLHQGKRTFLFSFLGIGPKKTWDAITAEASSFDTLSGEWARLPPVPGQAGRLAAAAAGVNDRVYLFGGYTVDAQGDEVSLPNVDIFDLKARGWRRGEDIPVPVDDMVVGVYRNRYVYLVSGWSQKDSVRNVQVYDTEKNRWLEATPIPGTPVFGHAGALAGDTIVYVGGAFRNPGGTNPRYVPSHEAWMGKIDPKDLTRITWTKIPGPPTRARYRIAAGAFGHRIVFSGGTDNPYNYDGRGYDGRPSEPVATTFAWNLDSGGWELLPDNPFPAMDHRGLATTREGLALVGGMEAGQKVSNRLSLLRITAR
ncbi:MAG TPA: kelch repeat-containing protein [Terriglobales bacterium]|nr:kelch repeat-containing protein [Terriglobales bacterium]